MCLPYVSNDSTKGRPVYLIRPSNIPALRIPLHQYQNIHNPLELRGLGCIL